MLLASTLLVVGTVLGVVFGLFVGQRRAPNASQVTLQQAARLACAQRWARGGACSQEAEPWRPLMTGLALAALLVRDETELRDLLEATAERCRDDAELLNIVMQARTEFDRAPKLRGLAGIAFFTDATLPTETPWGRHRLGTEATQVVESATKGARALLHARRSPSAPPQVG